MSDLLPDKTRRSKAAAGDRVLGLNPDVVLSSDFVTRIVAGGEAHPDAGSVCGKLLRWDPVAEQHRSNIIDSTGIYFTRNMRHLDPAEEG